MRAKGRGKNRTFDDRSALFVQTYERRPSVARPPPFSSAAGSGERFDNSLVRRLDFQALYLSVALAANYSFTRSQTCRMWPLPGSEVNAEGLGFPTGAQQARL